MNANKNNQKTSERPIDDEDVFKCYPKIFTPEFNVLVWSIEKQNKKPDMKLAGKVFDAIKNHYAFDIIPVLTHLLTYLAIEANVMGVIEKISAEWEREDQTYIQ